MSGPLFILSPIENDAEHAVLLAYLEKLLDQCWDPPADSDEGRELIAVATEVERYEKIRWPI